MKRLFTRSSNMRAALLLVISAAMPVASAQDAAKYFVHTAKDGDTLIGLAGTYLIDRHKWLPLQKLNKIADPRRIKPGTEIRIPLELMKTEPSALEVTAVEGPVESTAGKLAVGSRVSEGAAIKTGENGFVTLKLVDGSTLVVQSKSQVKLDTSRVVSNTGGVPLTNVNLSAGRVEAKVEKRRGPAPRFEISTPTSNMAVRGTQFRVSADDTGKASRGEVNEGIVNVMATANAGAPQDVSAGFGTLVESGQPPIPPVKLVQAPDLSSAAALQERILLRFKFAPLANVNSYRGQIAMDANFNRLIKDEVFKSTEAKFGDLADGSYFLRVRGIDSRGIEGNDAVLPFKLKARPEPPFTSAPANKDKFAGDKAEFKWAAATEANRYRFQLAESVSFSAPLSDERGVNGTAFSKAALKPGDYFWRVASVRADGDQGPFGDIQSFTLKAMPVAPNPPKEEGGRVLFSWGAEPGQKFDFQLARDGDFRQIVKETKLDKPEILVEKPTESGIYYMRYRAIDPDGFIGPFSSAQTIEVKPNYWWLLILLVVPFIV